MPASVPTQLRKPSLSDLEIGVGRFRSFFNGAGPYPPGQSGRLDQTMLPMMEIAISEDSKKAPSNAKKLLAAARALQNGDNLASEFANAAVFLAAGSVACEGTSESFDSAMELLSMASRAKVLELGSILVPGEPDGSLRAPAWLLSPLRKAVTGANPQAFDALSKELAPSSFSGTPWQWFEAAGSSPYCLANDGTFSKWLVERSSEFFGASSALKFRQTAANPPVKALLPKGRIAFPFCASVFSHAAAISPSDRNNAASFLFGNSLGGKGGSPWNAFSRASNRPLRAMGQSSAATFARLIGAPVAPTLSLGSIHDLGESMIECSNVLGFDPIPPIDAILDAVNRVERSSADAFMAKAVSFACMAAPNDGPARLRAARKRVSRSIKEGWREGVLLLSLLDEEILSISCPQSPASHKQSGPSV